MKVVTIEGIDGAGKTVFYNKIKAEAERQGLTGIGFAELPSDYFFSKYRKDMTDKEIEQLQNEDKAVVYKKYLEEGNRVMLSDRGDVTQKVYNGSKEVSISSNLVLYLSISVEDSLKRIQKRGVDDNLGFENEETLTELKKNYEEVLSREEYEGKVIYIDALKLTEEDVNNVVAYLELM